MGNNSTQPDTARSVVEDSDRILPTWKQLDVLVFAVENRGARVREVMDAVAPGLRYTSVLTLCQTLADNGWLEPVQDGRSYVYEPTVNWHELGVLYANLLASASPRLAEEVALRIAEDERVREASVGEGGWWE